MRIIAATNVNLPKSVAKGDFLEDLFYRLNTISIDLPPLRERGEDIHLLFRKFASDFAEQYNTSPVRLSNDAIERLNTYKILPEILGKLRNFVAQISIIETDRQVTLSNLEKYLPNDSNSELIKFEDKNKAELSEREILYKVLFDRKKI